MYGFTSKMKLGIFEKYVTDFDLICLSETRLTEPIDNEITGFKMYNHQIGGIHGK